MTDPELFSDELKHYDHRFAAVFVELFERYPEASRFDPCPCGVTMAVVLPQYVKPWHYVVPDTTLRDRVREIIEFNHLPLCHEAAPEAVLILCERA